MAAFVAGGGAGTAGVIPMRVDDLHQLARRHVPGSGEPQVEPLRAGLVNRSFRVSRNTRVFVLRVDGAAPGVDRIWECRVLQAAAAAGLAPAVVVCDPPAGVLVTAWAAGVGWSAEQAASPAAQMRLAALARRVHTLALPVPTRRMSVRGWRDLYRAQLPCAPVEPERGDMRADEFARSEALLAQYESLPPAQERLCHSDLHRHNVLVTSQDCVLLDWEYAHAGDPFWDLAGWARSNDLQRGQIDALLSAYLLRDPTGEEAQRLALLMRLYDLICRLWAEVAASQAPRAP